MTADSKEDIEALKAIGRSPHEEPGEAWNFDNRRDRHVLLDRQAIAIEPFLTFGKGRIRELRNGWSLRIAGNAVASQFEHTIIVTGNQPIVLTT